MAFVVVAAGRVGIFWCEIRKFLGEIAASGSTA